MNKNISLIILLLGLLFWLPSCSDDNDDTEVSQEWKDYQRSVLNKITSISGDGKLYTPIESESGAWRMVHVKDSEYIKNGEEEPIVFPDESTDESAVNVKSTSYSVQKRPPNNDTDVVLLRYEGWYYNLNGERIVFDSTEKKNSNGVSGKGREFTVNGVIDGFKTLLQTMSKGEEKIVCIPYELAYGTTGEYDRTYGTLIVPGYTTLFFDVLFVENVTEELEKEKK